VLVVLLLLLDDQSVPVLQCVFSAPIEVLHDLGPLLRSFVLLDALQQLDVLLWLPGALLEVGIEVAVPVFPALLGVSKYFVVPVVEKVKSLGDKFPILGVLVLALIALLVDEGGEQVALFLAPVVGGEVDLLKTEPLEHAGLGCNSWDERSDHFPVLAILNKILFTIYFSISWKRFLSAYLEMTQIKICTSSSLQFFLMRLFFIILI
jgi:hypothetical protein